MMSISSTCHISARNLSKQFSTPNGTIASYHDVDFNVERGEFICLLGPSGCGKTTLLRSIAGLIRPTTGELIIEPNTESMPAEIGMVFQERDVFPWMTVGQNIRFLLRNNKRFAKSDIENIVEAHVRKVGLERFINYFPHQLSGGMMQRISIARSFSIDPDILLMDEPFVYLDYQTRMSLQTMLLNIWQDTQKTIVFVTHDIEEAILLADRIMVMSSRPGSIQKIIPIELERPRNACDIRKSELYADYFDEITHLIGLDGRQSESTEVRLN